MLPKPKHLSIEYATQFKDKSVAAAYVHRLPYPDEVFDILLGLVVDSPRAVLDVGCGTGAIARHLVTEVDRVDAVDFSAAMLERGKQLARGDHPHLHWIYGSVEEVELFPPYALVTAGSSLHWMEWREVMARFQKMLTPAGCLAVVQEGARPTPWHSELHRIIPRFSTNREYQPYNLIEELEQRGLFEKQEKKETSPVPFTQSVEEYIESFHAMNGFSRERMSRESAAAFDTAVRELVAPFSQEGQISLQLVAHVVWGKPKRSQQ